MSDDSANLGNGGNGNQGISDGSNNKPAWTAQLDKDLQGNERLTQFKTIGDMGKTFLDLEGKLKNAIIPPGENATKEEMDAYLIKLGRPEVADKYSFGKPENLPEAVPYSQEFESLFKQFAFEKGISDKSATELYNWYWDLARTGVEQNAKAQEDATKQAVEALKVEWQGDTFKVKTELAARAFKALSNDVAGADKWLEETRIDGVQVGNHPMFLRIFANVGSKISNDSIASGDSRSGSGNALVSDEERARARFPNTKW